MEQELKVTDPLWAYEELQGSDFEMVRACSQCLWNEVQSLSRRTTPDLAEAARVAMEALRVARAFVSPTMFPGTGAAAAERIEKALTTLRTALDAGGGK